MQVDARTHAQTHSTCAQVSRDGFNTRAASAVSPDSWAVSHTDRPSSSVGSHTACAKLTHTLLSTCTRGITGIAHREPGYAHFCHNSPSSPRASPPACARPCVRVCARGALGIRGGVIGVTCKSIRGQPPCHPAVLWRFHVIACDATIS